MRHENEQKIKSIYGYQSVLLTMVLMLCIVIASARSMSEVQKIAEDTIDKGLSEMREQPEKREYICGQDREKQR